MKKIICFLLMSSFFVKTGFAKLIHDNCWDHTFSFHYMSVEVEEKKINFQVSGTVPHEIFGRFFTSSGALGLPRGDYKFSVPRESCRVSKDQKIMMCRSLKEITVQKRVEDNKFDKAIVDRMSVELRFVNAMTWNEGNFFELRLRDLSLGNTWSESLLFPGDREKGCVRANHKI